MKKKKPVRRRGTTSVPCPKCRQPTRVLRTGSDGSVTRRVRQCPRGHRTITTEAVSG